MLPPDTVNDVITDAPLMSVPLIIHPNELGFLDYRHLISLCYEVRGAPRQIVNLISTKCTSVNARYAELDKDLTFGTVGIRTVDSSGECRDIHVNRDCSVFYNRVSVSSNLALGNISIIFQPDSISVSVPNCGKEVVMMFHCLNRPSDDAPVINMTITRNYVEQDISHGLLGMSYTPLD